MAIKYVTTTGAGSHDGSSVGNAWTFAEMLAATFGASYEVRICADATYTFSATNTFNPTGASGFTTLIGANATGTVDGTRPTLKATANDVVLLDITTQAVTVKNLIFDGDKGGGRTGGYGLILDNSYNRAENCWAKNCAKWGLIDWPFHNTASFYNCEASNCGDNSTATGGISLGSNCRAFACWSHDNQGIGFYASAYSVTFGCVASNNTGTWGYGFYHDSVGYYCVNCAAYANAVGFEGTSNNALGTMWFNCVAYGNTSYGFTNTTSVNVTKAVNCAVGNNTTLDWSGGGPPADNVGTVTLSADPFTNAGSNDFTLNNTAGGGAACRAAGIRGFDIGAYQHADTGGAGGTRSYVG